MKAKTFTPLVAAWLWLSFSMFAASLPPPVQLPPFVPGGGQPAEIGVWQTTELERGDPWIPPPVAASDMVYSNAASPTGFFLNPTNYEIGDEINLGPGSRVAESFRFEYYGTGFSGNEQFRLRFYLNDGAYLGYGTYQPGSLFFDSGLFPLSYPISPSGRSTYLVDLSYVATCCGPFVLPERFTWSIQFYGIGPGEIAGVSLFQEPNVGTSEPDCWLNNAGQWELRGTNGRPLNFAATLVTASVSLSWSRNGNQLVLAWPETAGAFRLQSSTNLNSPVAWVDVTNAPVVRNGQFTVTNDLSGSARFYRLRTP